MENMHYPFEVEYLHFFVSSVFFSELLRFFHSVLFSFLIINSDSLLISFDLIKIYDKFFPQYFSNFSISFSEKKKRFYLNDASSTQ